MVDKTKVTGLNYSKEGLSQTSGEKNNLPKDKDQLVTEIDCLEVLEPWSLNVF